MGDVCFSLRKVVTCHAREVPVSGEDEEYVVCRQRHRAECGGVNWNKDVAVSACNGMINSKGDHRCERSDSSASGDSHSPGSDAPLGFFSTESDTDSTAQALILLQ